MINILKSLLGLLFFPARWPGWKRHWSVKIAYIAVISILMLTLFGNDLYGVLFRLYTSDKTAVIHFDNAVALTETEFETLAMRMETEAMAGKSAASPEETKDPSLKRERERLRAKKKSSRKEGYSHIGYFRDAGIRQYEGPKTCLRCHESMKVKYPGDEIKEVDTRVDVMTSAHFQLFKMDKGFSTVGYDGRQVNEKGRKIPVGKIDRACGIPGSFTWTGWATLAEATPTHGEPFTMSEGCGQCHIGGMYGPPSDLMMPLSVNDENRWNAVDCLICHSGTYDMNQRVVVKDDVGFRWNQDRSMKSAMGIARPTADTCLRCHQHNLGGDTYENNAGAKATGTKNPRILHAWTKRGTPFHPKHDVHSKAGLQCLDCHQPLGHKIPRGKDGVDLVSNDLPETEVSCLKCHSNAPHVRNRETRAMLNGHTERVACQTCHITRLQKNSVVLMDWVNPIFHEEEGIWTPNPMLVSNDVRVTAGYLWYNGIGTFLANALGDNPTEPENYDVYDPLMMNLTQYNKVPGLKIEGGGVEGNDFLSQLSPEMREKRRQMVDDNIRPYQKKGKSKIYPFHLFNAIMYEDMNNQGPFGAMILPFDYTTYFETGDPKKSMETAMGHPMVKRMYQYPFKAYMMDEFMRYFGITEGWKTDYPLDPDYSGKVEPHWMRQMGSIALNHGISDRGWACSVCHTTEGGLLDFRALGYTERRARQLQTLPETGVFGPDDGGLTFEDVYGPGSPKSP